MAYIDGPYIVDIKEGCLEYRTLNRNYVMVLSDRTFDNSCPQMSNAKGNHALGHGLKLIYTSLRRKMTYMDKAITKSSTRVGHCVSQGNFEFNFYVSGCAIVVRSLDLSFKHSISNATTQTFAARRLREG